VLRHPARSRGPVSGETRTLIVEAVRRSKTLSRGIRALLLAALEA
jgi:hypothetical protein